MFMFKTLLVIFDKSNVLVRGLIILMFSSERNIFNKYLYRQGGRRDHIINTITYICTDY